MSDFMAYWLRLNARLADLGTDDADFSDARSYFDADVCPPNAAVEIAEMRERAEERS